MKKTKSVSGFINPKRFSFVHYMFTMLQDL